MMSTFATPGRAGEADDSSLAGMDETKMEQAFASLAEKIDTVKEDDPRQMAALMRSFTRQSGMPLGDAMEEAISRLEAGEDPQQVEQQMGDMLEGEDLLGTAVSGEKKSVAGDRHQPERDDRIYEL